MCLVPRATTFWGTLFERANCHECTSSDSLEGLILEYELRFTGTTSYRIGSVGRTCGVNPFARHNTQPKDAENPWVGKGSSPDHATSHSLLWLSWSPTLMFPNMPTWKPYSKVKCLSSIWGFSQN